MPTLRLYLLGPLDIRYHGQQLSKPPTVKSQSLLAYLIFHRDQAQPRDRVAELFWGDRPERKARRSLTTALWHIRRCLPDETYILSDAYKVQFDPQADLWLDVDEFESYASHDDIASLLSGVALYRGDFLDGFYDEWIINERYRFEGLFCEALARVMVGQEARGAHDAALATALRLLDQDPLREDAHRLAMRACCRLGQRTVALEQYRRCRQILLEELGTEPMVETTELYEEILEGRFVVERVPADVPVELPALPLAAAVGRSPLDVVTVSKLVGREEELAFLNECWQAAETGRGGLVLISGEAGVGKTRLAEEVANRLRWQGVRVLWGRCYEFERVIPYQPIGEALRTVLPTLTSSELAEFPGWILGQVARLVPEVLQRRAGLGTTPSIRSEEERARLFEGVGHFLAELSSHGALLIVLEDLHWASESTLQLVHYLTRHLTGHQILMVGTFRPEAIGLEHPLLGLRRRLTKEGLAQSLRLSRLPFEAVEALVLEMSGAGEAILPLARRLAEETEGNPFFLMEMVKALFEMGTVRAEGDSWQGDFAQISEGELPLPVAVSEAIQARVRRLRGDSQEALRVVAVVGREFDFDLLKTVWGRDEEEVLEALDDLLRHRVIEEGSGAMGRDYAFTHHKIREVIYSAMPRHHRQRAHALVGGAMESIYGPEPEELAGELAYHFLEAQRHDKTLTEKAISYLLQAGDRARTFYAHEEAIDHYQGALALLKEVGDYERAARTLMKLGLTCHNAFDFKAARRAYQEGFVLWQRAGATEVAVRPPAAPHSLRVIWTEPVTLDPAIASLYRDVEVIRQLYSGLVETSPQLEVLPDVGRSWEVSDGGRRYVFRLRDDVRWSDGTPVTAGDFEYAWKRLVDPATSSPSANLLYDVKGAKAFHQGEASDADQVGVRALDEVTLTVELQGPTGYFLHVLACVPTYPVPRHAVEAHGEAWTEAGKIVTSGPFRLEAWNRGESMVLERNPEYHGRFTGNLERVEMPLLADRSTPLEAYKADSVDVLHVRYLPEGEAARAFQQCAGEWVSVPRLWTSALGFDVSRRPFDDVRVRRAFVLATDREALCEGWWPGRGSPAMGGFVPPGMPGHSPGIGLAYDPARARQLLAEAGYPHGGGFPPVAAVGPFLSSYTPILEYLEGQWLANLGVDVTFERIDPEVYWEWRASARPQVFPSAWVADYADPDDFLRAAPFRRETRWRSKVYDRLVEEARRAMDQRERMELYAQADRILVEEAPILLLFYEGEDLLVKPWVRRYPTSPEWLCFWKDVIIEPH